ncbi:methyl-accepting chemotaxis protein [Jeotgalibacillus salarius]|uniref:Methyl-accepting chemotaxis protein n=1 Tax=Jeotgalibacillus salarius TaxID=546023 RepID=A0A4Y8LSJ1_9BACL|nr:methyl-accepting chemotaxis protein [Jeotgalibacillus salarius]TFE03925.1 methyl-accepting chemotaxis protein [Jeotgalibacillus salarius]
MKIKGKLIVSYLIIAALLVGLAAVSLLSMREVNNNSNDLYDHRLIPVSILVEVGRLTENTTVQILTSVIGNDPELTDIALNNVDQIDQLIVDMRQTQPGNRTLELLDAFEAEWDQFSEAVTTTSALIEDGEYETAVTSLGEAGVVFANTQARLSELKEHTLGEAEKLKEANNSAYQINRVLIYGFGIVALLAAIGIGIGMGQAIGGPLKRVASRMGLLADGDLTNEPLTSKRKDEIGTLFTATNKMQDDLKVILSKIAAATDHVSTQSEELTQSANEVREGSEQIAVTMQELASGSEAQATNAGALSETMDEFAVKIQDTNQQSQEISTRSRHVMESAEGGSKMMESSVQQMMVIDQVMTDAVSKVRGLDEQTNEISKLVNVISDIAAQTNLLALNAAIEAARAGEQGKGFAVVADEVRKLAEQVSNSVNDITGFVNGIQTESRTVVDSLEKGYGEVNEGTKQISLTGEKFGEINGFIYEMIQMVDRITENLEDISRGSQTMNASVQEIASISEESAAGVEETAASSEQSLSTMETISASADELAGLAEELSGEVRKFKLNV